jgi:hypothetical protein
MAFAFFTGGVRWLGATRGQHSQSGGEDPVNYYQKFLPGQHSNRDAHGGSWWGFPDSGTVALAAVELRIVDAVIKLTQLGDLSHDWDRP